MIHVEGLKVVFQDRDGAAVPVLDVPELKIESGAQVCLVGGSGTGKTTLLNVLAGIVAPSEGAVRHGETDLAKLSEASRDRFRALHIGYVFQSFNLLQGLSALENVALAGTFGALTPGAARRRGEELLKRVDLGHRLHALPGTLSVGEQQRVGIARALINKPQVVLADEPTANLDEKRADEVLALLAEVAQEEGSTLVLVTHEPRVMNAFDDVRDLRELQR